MATALASVSFAAAAPVTPVVTLVPRGPFSSGQLIEVGPAPNERFKPGGSLTIEECAAPTPGSPPWPDRCDPRTKEYGRIIAHRRGSVAHLGYTVFALPDALTLHESARHRPVCDLTHACVLMISGGPGPGWGDGDHDSDDVGGPVWSLPFFVEPTGTDPPPNTPEAPYVLALPLLAAGIIGGTVLVRRRSSGVTHAR